jgi:integrase
MSLERYARKDGRITFSYKFFYKKRVYRGYIGTVSLKQAKLAEMHAKILAAEGKLGRHVSTPQEIPTLDAFTPRYLDWLKGVARPRTLTTYHSRLRWHIRPFLGELRLSQITTSVIDQYTTARRQEGTTASTINAELCVLSAVLRKASEWGLLPRHERGTIGWLRVEERQIRVLSEAEEERLLFAATPHLRPLIRFALQTGLRRDELLTLTWTDVDLQRKTVTIAGQRSKTHRSRTIPLSSTALAILEGCSPRGRIFGYYSVSTMFSQAARKAGLPGVSCHTLRHTVATRWLENGVNIRTVQRWLGHSSIRMTEVYLHPTDAYERRSIEVLGAPVSHQRESPSA